jgi:two-component system, NarL family, sensor histidine kinase DesK
VPQATRSMRSRLRQDEAVSEPLGVRHPRSAAPERQARAVALLIRLSVHVVVVLVPLLAAAAFMRTAAGAPDVLLVAGAVVFTGFLVAAVRLASAALDSLRDGAPRARSVRVRIGWCAGFALAAGVIAVSLGGFGATPALALMLAAGLGAVTPVLRAAPTIIGTSVIVVASAGVIVLTADASLPVRAGAAATTALSVVLLVAATWCSGLLLRMVYELDDARRTAALAAVTEERLRIARDLHDVFGRTLVAVALKSELAAGLAARAGADAAAAEMRDVHRLVEATGTEMRRVLRGTRQPELATEIEGARALLDAAGVRFRLDGEAGVVPEAAREAFAWTLREAVTNALRHADATRFEVSIKSGDDVTMELRNDGARTSQNDSGSGITAIHDRIGEIGGRASVLRAGDEFAVLVGVPR